MSGRISALRAFPSGALPDGCMASPRTAQRMDRQMNRNSNANSPYLSAESANGVMLWPSTSRELEDRRADRDAVPVGQFAGLDGLPVQAGAVRGAEVGEDVGAVLVLICA